jgi:hypothetical protein
MRHEAEAIRVADGASNQPHTLTSSILTAPISPHRDEIDWRCGLLDRDRLRRRTALGAEAFGKSVGAAIVGARQGQRGVASAIAA